MVNSSDAAAVPDLKEDISKAVKDIQKRLEEMRVNAAYPAEVKERRPPGVRRSHRRQVE